MRIALVVGGAEGVEQEVEVARQLCTRAGATFEFFACNDMISKLPDPCRAVTLHQGKLHSGSFYPRALRKHITKFLGVRVFKSLSLLAPH